MKARQNEVKAADHLASWGVEGFFGEGGRGQMVIRGVEGVSIVLNRV